MALAEKSNIQPELANAEFFQDVIEGLSQSPKALPCKYFYDERGSQLFEQICDTEEYYVTRTECEIYRLYADDMAGIIGPHSLLLEPGAGSVKKVALLLESLPQVTGFLPMDISPEILTESSALLSQQFPDLDITHLVVDFMDKESLQVLLRDLPKAPLAQKRVVFFPGSTIGNFNPAQASQFLAQFSEALLPGDGLLIGVDLVKEKQMLEAAYNDQAGITAAFNLNLLERINAELGSDFLLDNFQHCAIFNEEKSRIEMHLRSTENQTITLGRNDFSFVKNETIHTENSYKYTSDSFCSMVQSAGFQFERNWTDDKDLFAVFYFSVSD